METELLPYLGLSDEDLTAAKMFEILGRVKFPAAKKTREAITPSGRYFTLGCVPTRYNNLDCVTISKETKLRTLLVHLLTRFMRKSFPDFKFSSIQVNKSAPAVVHKDDNSEEYPLVGAIALVDEEVWGSSDIAAKGNTFVFDDRAMCGGMSSLDGSETQTSSTLPVQERASGYSDSIRDSEPAHYCGPLAKRHTYTAHGYVLRPEFPGRILELKNCFAFFDGSTPHVTIEEESWIKRTRVVTSDDHQKSGARNESDKSMGDRSADRYFLGFFVDQRADKVREKEYKKLVGMGFPMPPRDTQDDDIDDSMAMATDVSAEDGALGGTASEGKSPAIKITDDMVQEDADLVKEICKKVHDELIESDSSEDEADTDASSSSDDDMAGLACSHGVRSGGGASSLMLSKKQSSRAFLKANLPKSLPVERLSKKGEASTKVLCAISFSGYGTIAGPLVVAAVATSLPGVNLKAEKCLDYGVSNQREMKPKGRELAFVVIADANVKHAHHVVSAQRIDDIGLLNACHEGQRYCFTKLLKKIEVVDKIIVCGGKQFIPEGGFRIPSDTISGDTQPRIVETESVKKGKEKNFLPAAAGLFAKVIHQRELKKMNEEFPLYGFSKNQGYAGNPHKALLMQHGPCKFHRRSTKPVKDSLELHDPATKAKKEKPTQKCQKAKTGMKKEQKPKTRGAKRNGSVTKRAKK